MALVGIQGFQAEGNQGFLDLPTLPGRVAAQHRRLLQAFVELAAEGGFHGVTATEVCVRAGVVRRTFSYHFAGLVDAFVEAYAEADACLREAVRVAVAGDNGSGVLERCVCGMAAFAAEQPLAATLWFVEGYAGGPRIAEQRAETIAWLVRQVLADLDVAEAHPPERARRLAAEIAVGGVIGIVGDAVRAGATDELRMSAEQLAAAASYLLGRAVVSRAH